MNQKIEQVVNFLQGKSAVFTVTEINQICQILNSLKVNEEKVEKKDEPQS